MNSIKYILLILSITLFISCNENPYLKGERDKTIQISFERFEKDLAQLNAKDIEKQKSDLFMIYEEFFSIYNNGILRIGNHQSQGYNERILRFLSDSIYAEVYDTVALYYPNLEEEEKQLTEAFQNYNLLFPERKIPQCYTHISGFNTPVVVGDSILSISLENYLGADHVFYKKLGTYTYLLPRKERENLSVDAIRGWIISEFPDTKKQANLLDRIIQEGKMLFLLQVLMPEVPRHLIVGLTEEQYAWCENNEMSVWQFMIEKKHLFSKNQTVVSKYLQNGPFFNFYGNGSSPLIGKYIGWQIVSNYMDKNKTINISDLLKKKESQIILQESGYKPN